MSNEMITFRDYYGHNVQLSFTIQPFSKDPKHVWVICRYYNQWLLTEHPGRGIEFPGGKVEKQETAEEAACREVYEETGAKVSTLTYIGQYKVEGKTGSIVKNIYFAETNQLIRKNDYHETNGPVLITKLPINLKYDPRFSFIMKDDVLTRSMEQIRKLNRL